MNTKGIVAIALLGILLVSTFAISAMATPVVQAADNELFKITLLAPGNANLLRRQWGLITANSMKSVGINAVVLFLGWGGVYDRALTPPAENIGKTWEEGGYDALFIGYTPGSPTTPFLGTFQIYYSENIPPNSNYYLWNNSQSDQLLMDMLRYGYTTEGVQKFFDWQELQFDEIPVSQIFYETSILAATEGIDFNGFDWIYDNLGPVPQFLKNTPTEFVMASTSEPLNFNPPLSNSWYDTLVFSPIFDALYFVDNDMTYKPCLAESFTVSPDGYTYTYNLRQGVTWHDGWTFNADDVVFSWLAYLNPQSGSQQSATTAGYIGDDITFKWLNGTETRLVLDLAGGVGYYPATNQTGERLATIEAVDENTVAITIANLSGQSFPAATFHPEGEVGAVLPKHILENIPFNQWKTNAFNAPGVNPVVIGNTTVAGPIGTGAYIYVGYDVGTALVTLEKNEAYWNRTALESEGMFGIETYYHKYIVEKDAAIAALKNNEVNGLDQNYSMERDYLGGLLDFATVYVLEGAGIQQLGYNLRHPIWGTGLGTPNGQTDPANAALYAKYVRQAFDYLIPRDLIVQELMSGLGTPCGVHVNPVSAYKNPDVTYRPYDPDEAKALLALAGYETGVTPPGPEPGPAPEIGQVVGMYTVIEQSADGIIWDQVAVGTTDSLGHYYQTFNQTAGGTLQYQVVMTGLQIQSAIDNELTTDDILEYYSLPAEILSLPVTTSPITTSEGAGVIQFSGTFNIAPFDALSLYNALVTKHDLDVLNANILAMNASMNSQIAQMNTQISNLQTQINGLNASLATATYIGYAGIAIAIIALLIAIYALMRKR